MEEPYAKSVIKVCVGGLSIKKEIIFKAYHGKVDMIATMYNVKSDQRKELSNVELRLEDLKALRVAIDAQIKLFTPRK